MSIVGIKKDKVILKCKECGKTFWFDLGKSNVSADDLRSHKDIISSMLYAFLLEAKCEDCVLSQRKAEKERKEREIQYEHEMMLPDLISQAGIPPRMRFTRENYNNPPNSMLSNFVFRNRDKNMIISGKTGCGKTTSVCVSLCRMIEFDWSRALYITMPRMLTKWRKAKTGESADPDAFIDGLCQNYDVICIDEFAGKSVFTESGQELIFSLLDAISNGSARFKLWIVGNVESEDLPSMFKDYAPIARRLSENFIYAKYDNGHVKATRLKMPETL